MGYCVFALYTKDEKPDVCLSCFYLILLELQSFSEEIIDEIFY
ncbi:MAG: hypothetical protein AB1765_13515 [Candidatus Hydrogenedentota bacterium]